MGSRIISLATREDIAAFWVVVNDWWNQESKDTRFLTTGCSEICSSVTLRSMTKSWGLQPFVVEEIVDGSATYVGHLFADKDFTIQAVDGTDGKIQIACVLIASQYRRKGYAFRALQRVQELSKQNGYAGLILNVFLYNLPAVGLYKKLGFIDLPEVDNISVPENLDLAESKSFENGKYLARKWCYW